MPLPTYAGSQYQASDWTLMPRGWTGSVGDTVLWSEADQAYYLLTETAAKRRRVEELTAGARRATLTSDLTLEGSQTYRKELSKIGIQVEETAAERLKREYDDSKSKAMSSAVTSIESRSDSAALSPEGNLEVSEEEAEQLSQYLFGVSYRRARRLGYFDD